MKLKSFIVSLACLFVFAIPLRMVAEDIQKAATRGCAKTDSCDLPKVGKLIYKFPPYADPNWHYFAGNMYVPKVGDKMFLSPCSSDTSSNYGNIIYEYTDVEIDEEIGRYRYTYVLYVYEGAQDWNSWPSCGDYCVGGRNLPDATATPRLRTGGTEVSMPATSNNLPQADSSNGGCASCAAPALPFDRRPGNLSVAIGLGIDSKVAAQVAYEPNLTEVHQLSLSDLKIQNVLGDYQGNLLSGSVTVLDQLGLIQSTISVQTTPPIDPNAGYPGQNFQSIVLTVTPVGEAGRPVTTHTFERVSATGADFTGQGVRYTRTEGSQTQTMAFYNSGDGACGRNADGTLWGSFKTVDTNGNVELWTAAPEDSAISWDETQGSWGGN